MEEFATLWMSMSVITSALIPVLILGCGKKEAGAPEAAVGPDGKPAIPTKACNTKSGLLNDDPDLKSDLLMPGKKPAGGDGGAPPQSINSPTPVPGAPPA